MTNAQFLAIATAATLLETVNGAAKVAKSNPTEANCETFVTIKRAFNIACLEMKYHALDLSMARQYLRDGQYRLNKLLTQYGDLPPKFRSTPECYPDCGDMGLKCPKCNGGIYD